VLEPHANVVQLHGEVELANGDVDVGAVVEYCAHAQARRIRIRHSHFALVDALALYGKEPLSSSFLCALIT
jgi:hypothetical protein